MANIISVRLENFQSHLDTCIEFNKGLNVIVGQSDSGKTAILRGIRWALYNQPRGTDFIRVGADFVRVTVSFDHGRTIIRERTNSKNRYTIRYEDKEELVLEGFGVHVPVEVLEAHGMNHLRIDQETELMIHLSQQLDGPFLLEQTSAARAKTLGRISGAHFLDMAIRETAKDLSQINQRLKQGQETIEHLNEQLAPYEPLDEMKNQLNQTNIKISHIKQLERKKHTLQQLKEQFTKITESIKAAERERELVRDLDVWTTRVENLHTMLTRYAAVKEMNSQYSENAKALVHSNDWIKKTAHAALAMEKQREIQEKLEVYHKLKRITDQHKLVHTNIDAEKQNKVKGKFVDSIPPHHLESIQTKQRGLQQLLSLKAKHLTITKEEQSMLGAMQKLPPLLKVTEKTEEIESAVKRYDDLQRVQRSLKEVSKRIIDGTHYIKEQKENQEQMAASLEARLLEEGTCPTCGQQICKHEGGERG